MPTSVTAFQTAPQALGLIYRGAAIPRLVYKYYNKVGLEHGGKYVPNADGDTVILFVTGPGHKGVA